MQCFAHTCSDEGDSPVVGFVAFIDFVAILSVYIICHMKGN